jgi:hypothetical protein
MEIKMKTLKKVVPTSMSVINVNHVQMPEGCIMLDTGCKASVGGTDWYDQMTAAVTARGRGHLIEEHPQDEYFRFGDGRVVQSTQIKIYPIVIRGKNRRLGVSVVEGTCPGLMSGDDIHCLEGVISLKDHRLQLLGEWGPLMHTPSGHPIADLTEYEPNTTFNTTLTVDETGLGATVTEPEAWDSDSEHESLTETASSDNEAKKPGESDYETESDLTESTDHEVDHEESESDQDWESSASEEEQTYEVHKDYMYSKHLSKGQKRKILRNLQEIAEQYTTNETYTVKRTKPLECPRQISLKPTPRTPGPWRALEIFTWTAIITIMAGLLPNWESYEPVTLPRWDLLIKSNQDDALRYIVERDIDFVTIAWPCTPWSIMQNLKQMPHQIRNLKLQKQEHRVLLVFVEKVAHLQYTRMRPYVGENPHKSKAWDEPPIVAAFNRPGNTEVVTQMCMYKKRRPETGELVRKATMLKGTREV